MQIQLPLDSMGLFFHFQELVTVADAEARRKRTLLSNYTRQAMILAGIPAAEWDAGQWTLDTTTGVATKIEIADKPTG